MYDTLQEDVPFLDKGIITFAYREEYNIYIRESKFYVSTNVSGFVI